MPATESLKRALAGFLAVLALVASSGTHAEGAAGPPPEASPSPTAAEIEAAITVQSGRRRSAIGTTVLGGIAIVAGYAISVADCFPFCGDDNDNGALNAGLLIGVPCIVGGVWTWIDSSREIRALRRQRTHLSLSPGSDSLTLTLAYEF